jgi:hypothetical protein
MAGSGSATGATLQNVRITGSDRDGIVLDSQFQTVVTGCITDGSSITGNDLVVRGCHRNVIVGNYFNGDVTIESDAQDTQLWSWVGGTLTDNGVRTIVNGVGTNSGDPRSTGEWNENGREGVTVYDISTSPWTEYVYRNGGWQATQ